MFEVYLEPLGEPGAPAGGIAVTRFPCIIGRHPECQHCLDDASVSRRHCLLFAMSNQIWVQDLGSSNGTFVNEERLDDARALQDGDALRIAHLAFEVQVPLCPNLPAVKPISLPQTMRTTRKPHHILVVEDNPEAAQALATLLQDWGHTVVVAHDGNEALEAAINQPLDLVLMDLRLPGMDGFHVAQQLRFQAHMQEATFVAVTGYGPPHDERLGAGFAFDRVLTKPVDPDELEEVLYTAAR